MTTRRDELCSTAPGEVGREETKVRVVFCGNQRTLNNDQGVGPPFFKWGCVREIDFVYIGHDLTPR